MTNITLIVKIYYIYGEPHNNIYSLNFLTLTIISPFYRKEPVINAA